MCDDNNCWIEVRTDGILRQFCLAWGWRSVLCFSTYLQVCVWCVCVFVRVRAQFHFLLPWAKLYVLAGCESLPFHFQTFPHRCKLCQNFLARQESTGAYSMQITQPSSKSKCKEAVYEPQTQLLVSLSTFLSLSFIKRSWISTELTPHFFSN